MKKLNAAKAIRLLSQSEYEEFYSLPIFTEAERRHFFTFNQKDQNLLQSLSSIEEKVYTALLLGYFRAKRCLVSFTYRQVTADRQFVMSLYFEGHFSPKSLPSEAQQIRLENKILTHENYHRLDFALQDEMLIYLGQAIRQHPKAKALFQALLDHMAQCCITLPAYSTLQKLISKALSQERNRLTKIYYETFSKAERNQLKKLLAVEDKLSQLHQFKKDPKSFNYTEMRKELKKYELLKPIYNLAITFLPKLELPQETIHYYGSLVLFYNVYKLKRMKPEQAHLYCLCYSILRYQHTNDNLLRFFNYFVDRYDKEAREESGNKLLKIQQEMRQVLWRTGDLLELILIPPFNNSISKRQCFSALPREEMLAASLYLKGALQDEMAYYWEHVDEMAKRIRRNLTSLFSAIDFSVKDKSDLLPIVDFFKEQAGKSTRTFQIPALLERWISKSTRSYLLNDKEADSNLFKASRLSFYFYKQLSHQVKTGKVFLTHSIEYRSLEDDLIPREIWEENSQEILADLGYPKLVTPIEKLLQDARQDLHDLIIEVNQRIQSGENAYIKIKPNNSEKAWTLPYEKKADITNNPFFKQLTSISIIEVLQQVNEQCHFLDKLTPIQPHSVKVPRSNELKLGAIFANAIRLGTYKMAQASNLSHSELLTTEKTCLRLETLRAAVDMINNEIATLLIFPLWNLNDALHGSVDGSKIGTRLETLKSRYSPKYFGFYKGVAAYNLSVNNLSPALRLIGAYEYEGHFLYDIYAQNTSNIDPQNISGDGHSINRLNFTLLDMVDRGFMPCFPKLNQQEIYCFGNLNQYEHCLIKPSRSLNEGLIKREWPNILHVLASIYTGEVSQSTLIGKLSSHDYISPTKNALWEYDNILKSIYVLLYIDDVTIRQSVRAALNRGEAYHQLCRAIAMLNEGDFRGTSEYELEVWNECARLVASAIIYYNSHLLSSLYEQAKTEEEQKQIIQMSPVAWAHINLLGRYVFSHKTIKADFKKLALSLKIN